MNIQKILFPTDFSHTGDTALSMATSLARDTGALMLIVHVAEAPQAYGGGDYYYGPPTPSKDDLNNLLSKVVPDDDTVPCVHILSSGDPALRIVEIAEEEGADLIVMGTHGRSGIMRALLGSVAESIVRNSTVPVLTFKQPARVVART